MVWRRLEEFYFFFIINIICKGSLRCQMAPLDTLFGFIFHKMYKGAIIWRIMNNTCLPFCLTYIMIKSSKWVLFWEKWQNHCIGGWKDWFNWATKQISGFQNFNININKALTAEYDNFLLSRYSKSNNGFDYF